MHYLDEHHILLFLLQLFVLLLLARCLGEWLRRRGQPTLTAEMLVGIALGPTLLGRLAPGLHGALFPADPIQQNMLETVAWLGVLLLLLQTGLEIDFSVAWRQRGSALVIAVTDIVVPMVVAFIPCLLLPDHFLADPDRRVLFALFMATVMTISAMPVAARVLHDLNVLKAELGFLIMSALAVNDIVGWVIFTIVLGLFMQAAPQLGALALVLAGTVGFAVLALTFGRGLSTRVLSTMQRRGLPEPGTSLTFACLLGLLFGAFTQWLGIHALFGFFIAGVVMGESRALSEDTRRIIAQMVYALFVPLFFVNIGLKIDFVAAFHPGLVAFVSLIGVAGRYLGAWAGARFARVPRMNTNFIAIAHTPGGMMEIVVALLALENGLITEPVFVAIVFSAVFSSVVAGPWMRRALQRRAKVRAADFVAPDTVVPALAATSRDDAIRELAGLAAGVRRIPAADRITGLLLQREAEFGTALGGSTAVPHARVKGLTEPVIAYGRSAEGVDWNAPDGKPVRHVFLLLTPAGLQDVHLQLVASVARMMQQPEHREALEAAEDADALAGILREALEPAGPKAL